MAYDTLLIEHHDAVTLVRLNRPQALNALNSQVLADLIAVFAAYDADPAQRCLVLTGSEKAFAAGADIKEMSEQSFADMYASNFFAGYERITATRKPWLAAVNGFALGGGCELAMMADIMPRCAGVRRPGAAALDLAYVAAGYTDGFFEAGLSPWDVAAGSLLVTEAGGLVGNFTGEANFLDQKECLAGNPKIYGQLVGLLGKYSKFATAEAKAGVIDSMQASAAQ